MEETSYKVTVETGAMEGADTNSAVSLIVFGTNGTSQKQALDNFWNDDFKKGAKNVFTFEDVDVGAIEYIELSLDSCSWYVNHINIEKNGEQIYFPIYEWLPQYNKSPLVVATNKTKLPQKDSTLRQAVRSAQTKKYPWAAQLKEYPLAGFADFTLETLPDNITFEEKKTKQIRNDRSDMVFDTMFEVVRGMFDPIDKIEEYREITSGYTRMEGMQKKVDHPVKDGFESNWIQNWQTDEELGRQVLNGVNPNTVEKVQLLPKKFNITNDHLKGLLPRGLDDEIKAGNIFIINHEILEGLNTGTYEGQKLQLASPFCLLYLRPDKKLVPIAIQLLQDESTTIWTPNDTKHDWCLAKLWWKHADAQFSQMVTHLSMAHFMIEPIAMALFRNLPSCHPVHKILRQHVQLVIANNVLGREKLIAPGGAAERCMTLGLGSGENSEGRPSGFIEILSKSYQKFDYNDLDLKENIKRRGVEDIPNYYYRDDSIRMCNAISAYVSSLIELHYETDKDVQEDNEIQSFAADLFSNGFPGKDGFPKSFGSIAALQKFVSKFIFIASCGHAAANYYLFEYFRFAPNLPLAMRGTIPGEESRGKANEATLLASLPPRVLARHGANITYILTRYAESDICLLPEKADTVYPRWLFSDSGPERKVFDEFLAELKIIDDDIEERNRSIDCPYSVLKPSRVPIGITI